MNKEELLESLEYWENYQPVNNMGKYARSVRVEAIKKELKKIEDAEIKNKEESQEEDSNQKDK